MGARPFGVVTPGEPEAVDLPSGWRPITVDELPSEPFDLGGQKLAVVGTVAGDDDAADALMAAARGCAVVVRLHLDQRASDAFLDDLGRLVDVRPIGGRTPLDAEQVTLLERLADGDTVTAAARHLGWSRRTATRRLEDAKRRLGVASTSEAVQSFRTGG